MTAYQSSFVIGFHSCDREVGLRVLNGEDELSSSNNVWDWLGPGIYFWEQDALRALQYAHENASGIQKNNARIKTPFVIGAIIEIGNCLNLVEADALALLREAYTDLIEIVTIGGKKMPVNKGKNRQLDCAVIQYIHQSNQMEGRPNYDTVRCAFPEGEAAYPGAMITSRLHIQLCVCNPGSIKGYFIPRPLSRFNSITAIG